MPVDTFNILPCMTLVCPECKNTVDLSSYSDLKVESVVECNMCGITLMITEMNGDDVSAEIIDEGK